MPSALVATMGAVWTGFAIMALTGDAVLHRLVHSWPWLAGLIAPLVFAGAGVFQRSALRKRAGKSSRTNGPLRAALLRLIADGPEQPKAAAESDRGRVSMAADKLLEHARGRNAEGVPHARQAVRLCEQCAGPDSVEVAADLAVLGALLAGQHRLDEAEAIFRATLATWPAGPPRTGSSRAARRARPA